MTQRVKNNLNQTFQTSTFNIEGNKNLIDSAITSQFLNANGLEPLTFNGYNKLPDEFIGSIDRTNRLRLPVELIGSVNGTKKPQIDRLSGLRDIRVVTRNGGTEFGFTVVNYCDHTTHKIADSGCVSLTMAFNQLAELPVGQTLLEFDEIQKSKKVLIRPEQVNGGTVFFIEDLKVPDETNLFLLVGV